MLTVFLKMNLIGKIDFKRQYIQMSFRLFETV